MTGLILERMETSDHGTFGQLILPNGRVLFTGELPDRGNQPNVSCIPTGVYGCEYTFSPAFKRMLYLVVPVPGRSGIRIHPANLMGDKSLGFKCQLNGCIALGLKMGWMDGQKAVLLSAPAVSFLEGAMERGPFELEIR